MPVGGWMERRPQSSGDRPLGHASRFNDPCSTMHAATGQGTAMRFYGADRLGSSPVLGFRGRKSKPIWDGTDWIGRSLAMRREGRCVGCDARAAPRPDGELPTTSRYFLRRKGPGMGDESPSEEKNYCHRIYLSSLAVLTAMDKFVSVDFDKSFSGKNCTK